MRQLIEDAVAAEGIEVLVEEVSIFSGDFEKKMAALKSDEAKASEMEHGIRHEIHVRLEENPAFYRSLRERLEKIIEDRKARRITEAQQLKLFQELAKDAASPSAVAAQAGLSERAFAIYGLLAGGGDDAVAETVVDYNEMEPSRKATAEILEELVADDVGIVDWVRKDDVQREMRKRIKRQLVASGHEEEEARKTAERVLELLKAVAGR